jgi:UDP:flavonoid glycosyltransferase YjiC (YdhE family)
VFPTRERPLKPYEAAARAALETRELVRELQPDVVVNDVLTLAANLAGELEGRPRATLIPHFYPPAAPGLPPFGIGALPPRTRLGRSAWRAVSRQAGRGVERGRQELNGTRARVGLPPLERPYGGISAELCIVGAFPQLEYPRAWPPGVHVTGPLMWEPPFGDVEPPGGDSSWPLVLVAPSRAQDREGRMLRAALEGLAALPVRVLATTNRRGDVGGHDVPPNARLVDWVSYSRTMPRCDLVVCHVGHGTLMRALTSGVPVVACPAAGDMNENAARADWAGVGVRLPRRLVTARGLRLAVQRALATPSLRARAGTLAAWAAARDPADRAAELLEEFVGDAKVR